MIFFAILILGYPLWFTLKWSKLFRSKSLQNGISLKVKAVDEKFDWTQCTPLQLYPFLGKRNFNPSMGVKNLSNNLEELFLIENTYRDTLDLRKKNLEDYEEKLIHCNDEERYVSSVRELYDIILSFMCQRYPQYFKMDPKRQVVFNTITNDTLPIDTTDLSGRDLMKLIALNIEEDVLIMLKDDPTNEGDEYILRASLTGLPAGFDPSHNFDQPISHIHKVVPQYEGRLRSPMHRFFNKIKSTDLWQRANWSIQTNNVFFKLEDHHGREGDVLKELKTEDIDFDMSCFLRCERQLLTRLPKSHAVLMLVRTYLTPVKNIKVEGFGEDLARAIESLPEDLAFYKRRAIWGKAVTEYLRKGI